MKNGILLLLFCITFAFGETPREAALRRIQTVNRETIPHLELDRATVAQSLDVIRTYWERGHPAESLPVVFTDFPLLGDVIIRSNEITMDVQNIPYLEAVIYVGSIATAVIYNRGGVLDLSKAFDFNHGWTWRTYNVSSKALALLGLQPNSSPGKVYEAFARLGALERPTGVLELQNSGRQLKAICNPPEQEKILGILALCEAGYKITK